jgi:alpha-L-rhamnosidase
MRAALAENYVSGIITDTPQYEKNGWTGDAQLSVPTAALQFDAERQFWKSFQDMADAQEPTGELTLLAPTAKGYSHAGQVFKTGSGAGASPIWEAFWFVIPWESYLRYGDVRSLEVTYPLMQKYLDNWIPQWTERDGDNYKYTLTAGLGDWAPSTGADAPDGAPTKFRTPTIISPSVTAYYAYLAKITADAARALGKAADARRYDLLFENIKTDFNAKWWDDKVGFYREDSTQVFIQGMAALPLAFGLVPDGKRAGLQAKLVEDVVKTRAGHAMVGIASMRWILPVLSQAADDGVPGAADAAYAIMAQTTYPSYGYWISLGWTALGEYWEKSSRTRSHHMYGTGVQWLYENLAGIQAMEPGYKRVAFRPTVPTGLDHAEATYDSVRGKIGSSWTKSGSTLTLDVTVPPNAAGVVYVPGSDPSSVKVSDTANATFVGKQGNRLVYNVDSGSYRFTVGTR